MLLHSNSVYISQKLAITNMISFVFNVITLHRSIVGIIIATSNMKRVTDGCLMWQHNTVGYFN